MPRPLAAPRFLIATAKSDRPETVLFLLCWDPRTEAWRSDRPSRRGDGQRGDGLRLRRAARAVAAPEGARALPTGTPAVPPGNHSTMHPSAARVTNLPATAHPQHSLVRNAIADDRSVFLEIRTRAVAPRALSRVPQAQIDRFRRGGVGRFGAAMLICCDEYFPSLSDGFGVGTMMQHCVGGFRCSSNGQSPPWRLGSEIPWPNMRHINKQQLTAPFAWSRGCHAVFPP